MNQVLQARPATSDDFRGCLRLWGNGGLFGYYGLFRTSALGKSTWYMTNRKKAVVVVTGEKTALFSPDDVDGFLAAIRASVPVQDKAPEAVMGTRRRSGAFLLKVAGAGIAGGSVVLVALALRYNPGPPPYTLTAGALTIDDRFYPITIGAASVDVKGVRVVDLDSDPQWRPTVRTNGFANQHYRSGWFRVANGTTVRLYRADGRRLVLLPPKRDDAPVLLEVAEPDRFVDEVRQKWLGR